jgi:diacylglycerol kinase family enzyme
VIAWGGDGTINEVASALAFGDVPLGIVRAGSGNGLARELGVDPRADVAIANALAATPQPMDVGEIEGRLFANIAGIGVDAFVASRFSLARRRGFLGYVGITAKALATYVPTRYRITSDGTCVDARAVLVTIANSAQFGNGARIAARARASTMGCWIWWCCRSAGAWRRSASCRGCSTAPWRKSAAARSSESAR